MQKRKKVWKPFFVDNTSIIHSGSDLELHFTCHLQSSEQHVPSACFWHAKGFTAFILQNQKPLGKTGEKQAYKKRKKKNDTT